MLFAVIVHCTTRDMSLGTKQSVATNTGGSATSAANKIESMAAYYCTAGVRP